MKMLVHVPRITDRVLYTFDLVFKQLLGLDFSLTSDVEKFTAYEGPKMVYGPYRLGDAPFQKAHELLFERHINDQETTSVDFEGVKGLFPVYGKGLLMPFDVFAASFYLVSRYEEYLPQVRDKYGRFQAESTWMFENGLLQKPLVDIWAIAMKNRLIEIYPNLLFKERKFEFVPTYDVDAAWAYKHNGDNANAKKWFKEIADNYEGSDYYDEAKTQYEDMNGGSDSE